MSERHQWPDSPRFSKVEAEDLANSNLSSKITDTVTFGDIWQRRKTFALVPMEEGVLKNWSWERIAVCGDAAHKTTVNLGQGGNCAIEGAAALANVLNTLNSSRVSEKASLEGIRSAFDSYQELRNPRLLQATAAAADSVRSQSFESFKCIPFLAGAYFQNTFLANLSTELFRHVHLVDYLARPVRLENASACLKNLSQSPLLLIALTSLATLLAVALGVSAVYKL